MKQLFWELEKEEKSFIAEYKKEQKKIEQEVKYSHAMPWVQQMARNNIMAFFETIWKKKEEIVQKEETKNIDENPIIFQKKQLFIPPRKRGRPKKEKLIIPQENSKKEEFDTVEDVENIESIFRVSRGKQEYRHSIEQERRKETAPQSIWKRNVEKEKSINIALNTVDVDTKTPEMVAVQAEHDTIPEIFQIQKTAEEKPKEEMGAVVESTPNIEEKRHSKEEHTLGNYYRLSRGTQEYIAERTILKKKSKTLFATLDGYAARWQDYILKTTKSTQEYISEKSKNSYQSLLNTFIEWYAFSKEHTGNLTKEGIQKYKKKKALWIKQIEKWKSERKKKQEKLLFEKEERRKLEEILQKQEITRQAKNNSEKEDKKYEKSIFLNFSQIIPKSISSSPRWHEIKELVQIGAMVMTVFAVGTTALAMPGWIQQYEYIWNADAFMTRQASLDSLVNDSNTIALQKLQTLPIAGDENPKDDYNEFISINPPDTRIVIPKIAQNIPIVFTGENARQKEDWELLEKEIQKGLQNGVVHYPGTAQPGETGNVFITGHSSYYAWDPGKYKDVFAPLHNLEVGDEYFVYHKGKKYNYIITERKIVPPSDTSVLDQDFTKKESTLMTCTPIGTAKNRLILKAEQVKVE